MGDLKSGILRPVLERVLKDSTLMLAIRDGYINIYYRGGNLLRITEIPKTYTAHFDRKFDLSSGYKSYLALGLPTRLGVAADAEQWVKAFPLLKEYMDFWFAKHPKCEREFQQLVERENNRSPISGSSEYFITDIECADSTIGARFDVLAVKWPGNERKNGAHCTPVFIEIKYGDNSLKGPAGLVKHITDIDAFLSNPKNKATIIDMMKRQFEQLDELGLLSFRHTKKKITITLEKTPEFIILMANHNPRSQRLKSVLHNPIFATYAVSTNFNLRFFVSSDAGYGLFGDNMMTYADYLKRL